MGNIPSCKKSNRKMFQPVIINTKFWLLIQESVPSISPIEENYEKNAWILLEGQSSDAQKKEVVTVKP